MFKKLLAIVLFLFSSIAFAQNPSLKGEGKITGTLTDSLSKEVVEFATVTLFKYPNLTQPVNGTISDEKGKFEIKELAEGQYQIKISFLGYNDKTIERVKVGTGAEKNQNLGSIFLSPAVQLLKEVNVVGQAAVIEEKVDRLIYNAEKDITSKGGDASEVLRKVPLLSVDLDGNVQLRGSSSIRVLINNKPSTIMASSVADALKQIPADQVKSVEVITSPSAKYDAEGATGIVNIITKKNNLQGYSLGVDLGGGNRGGTLGVNGNLKVGKLGFTLAGNGGAFNNPSKSEFYQEGLTRFATDTAFVTRQFGEGKDKMVMGRYSLGVDYDITPKKSLAAGARFGNFWYDRRQDLLINEYTKINGTETLLRNSALDVVNNMPNNNWDFNLDYLHVIKPQQEFSISTLYSTSTSNSNFSREPISGTGVAFENENDSKNKEFTIQTDYMAPIAKNQSFEVGAKGIFRTVESEFENISKMMGQSFSSIGDLNYQQNIAASYLSYTYTTNNKYTFKVGGRYEYTDISASTLDLETRKHLNIPSYGNFVPSVNISKTLANNYMLKLAYNKRIQRPGMQHLNPNENQANPLRITRGNPELDPEISNNIEASISGAINKLYVNLAVFTRFTDNAISNITTRMDERGEGVTLTTYQNVGKSQTNGANLNANYQITPKWSLSGALEAYHLTFEGLAPGLDGLSLDFSNSGWNFNGRLMTNLTLQKGWQVQGFGFMRGSTVIAQGTQNGYGHYSLGFRKDFKNKKGSIGFNTTNFLANKMKFTSSLDTYQNIQRNIDYRYNRGFNVTLSYRIGKMGADSNPFKRKAKGVKNDDVLSTGEQQG